MLPAVAPLVERRIPPGVATDAADAPRRRSHLAGPPGLPWPVVVVAVVLVFEWRSSATDQADGGGRLVQVQRDLKATRAACD